MTLPAPHTATAPAGLQAFLHGLIDYAGLFPPAVLPLDQALTNYTLYRTQPTAWMLGRFIMPVGQLTQLTAGQLASGPAFDFSVLGRGADTAAEWLTQLQTDQQALTHFLHQHPGRATASAFEVRLPLDMLRSGEVDHLADLLAQALTILGEIQPFFEVPFVFGWETMVQTAVLALQQTGRGGLKLRCGGVKAEQFPSVTQLATAILSGRDAGVMLKFTAGLHHPLRHFYPELEVMRHGFVNVLGGALLAYGRGLNQATLEAILSETNPQVFRLDNQGLAWREQTLTLNQLSHLRQTAVLSYGSCSFDEPREDLQTLGWLNYDSQETR